MPKPPRQPRTPATSRVKPQKVRQPTPPTPSRPTTQPVTTNPAVAGFSAQDKAKATRISRGKRA